MEFFDWMTVPQIILNYLSVGAESAAGAVAEILRIQKICLIVAAVLYLAGLICGGFGLMTMAKKQGIKHWWLGFVPFGCTYLAGKLAGETKMFSQRVKRLGLYAMIAEIIYVALNITMLVLSFELTNENFYVLESTYEGGPQVWQYQEKLVIELFPELAWVVTTYKIVSVAAQIEWFILLFLMCYLFSALYRKYFARSPFVMTFLSAFLPLRGFVLLAVRNNTPMDYNAYLRRRYEEMHRSQGYGGQGYGGNGSENGGFGGYNGGQGSGGSQPDPFSEFGSSNSSGGGSQSEGGSSGSSNDSPFSDF